MWQKIVKFKSSHLQTKIFVLHLLIYLLALTWTTSQAYARLLYSRSDLQGPIFIQNQPID